MGRVPLRVKVLRGHVKYEGVTQRTLQRYRRQVLRFFDYLDTYNINWPRSPGEFDHVTGEYVNHLYQDMDPYGYAGDFLSGIRRFLPRWRCHTQAAGQYFRNWRRTLSFRQALPLPADVIQGIAGVALADGRPRVAVAFLVGYVGLLRTTELLKLSSSQLHFVRGDTSVVISLPDSKGAKRQNNSEKVIVSDPSIVKALAHVVRSLEPADSLVGMSAKDLADLLKKYGAFLGIYDERLTLYSLRRGGASWHFTTYQNLDATRMLGRWQWERTARLYIDGAVAELVNAELTQRGARRAAAGRNILTFYLTHFSLPTRPDVGEGWGRVSEIGSGVYV